LASSLSDLNPAIVKKGDVHTYVWLEHFDYVIVMKRYRDGRRRLITAYWVDYESKRRALLKKYSTRLP
jgi:hypothetical protein